MIGPSSTNAQCTHTRIHSDGIGNRITATVTALVAVAAIPAAVSVAAGTGSSCTVYVLCATRTWTWMWMWIGEMKIEIDDTDHISRQFDNAQPTKWNTFHTFVFGKIR